MRYRKCRPHERASLAMSGQQATIRQDIPELREKFMPELRVGQFFSAVLYGNEDAPTQIEMYEAAAPLVTDWPEIWIPEVERKPVIIERLRRTGDGNLASLGCETVESVWRQIKERLTEAGMIDEYFSLDPDYRRRPGKTWPSDARWVVAFPVVGGSEGHYIHVEALWSPISPSDVSGRRRMLMLGKTFQGWDHAWKMAEFIARLLEDASWGHVEEDTP